MKKVAFIGSYDKSDIIIYIAKIITSLDKKVLVVDATINQKARYIIPAMLKLIQEQNERIKILEEKVGVAFL